MDLNSILKRGAIAGTIALSILTDFSLTGCSSNRASSLESTVNHGIEQKDRLEPKYKNFLFPMDGIVVLTELYEYPNAKRILINIPQVHDSSYVLVDLGELNNGEIKDYLKLVGEENLREANESQRDIYQILGYLEKKNNLEYVLLEGVIKKREGGESLAFYLSSMSRILEKGYFVEVAEEKKYEDFRYIPGAADLFAMTGSFRIEATENEDLLRETVDSLINEGLSGVKKYNEPRENYAIERASKLDGNTQVLIFGEGHDFRNNIREWNETHPEERYSLMVLRAVRGD